MTWAIDFTVGKNKLPDGEVMIYSLVDSRDPDQYRYVGQTRRPRMRLWEHIRDANRERNKRANWIKSVIKSGGEIHMAQLVVVPEEESSRAEAAWIGMLWEDGHRLKNGTTRTDIRVIDEGGRARLSVAHKRAWADPNKRANIVAGLNRPEVIEKRRAAGKMQWDGQRREKMLAAVFSEDAVAARRAARASEEYKRNHAEKTSAAWARPGAKEKRIAAVTAALNRPETRRALSETRKAHLARPGVIESISAASAARTRTPEGREEARVRANKSWSNPEERARRVASMKAAGEKRRRVS